MEAIVRVAGVQVRVAPGDRIMVPRLKNEVGSTTALGEVLLLSDGKKVTVGTPVVEGAHVEAEILEHARDKKIIVFKKKRRKRYRRTMGHRQRYTAVRITDVVGPEKPARKRSPRKAKAAPEEQTAADPSAEQAAKPAGEATE